MDVLRQELEKTHKGGASRTVYSFQHVPLRLKAFAEPRWIVDQEVKRHLDEYEANEKQMRERLDHIRIEKEKKSAEMKRRANFARKRPVSLVVDALFQNIPANSVL